MSLECVNPGSQKALPRGLHDEGATPAQWLARQNAIFGVTWSKFWCLAKARHIAVFGMCQSRTPLSLSQGVCIKREPRQHSGRPTTTLCLMHLSKCNVMLGSILGTIGSKYGAL